MDIKKNWMQIPFRQLIPNEITKYTIRVAFLL
jgi:hypothetical protein